MAKDPRPIIVHEGVPGHYSQLWLSWSHENEIRRRYVDSGSNEGIGFYAEEMMLQAGLFDDSPKTREMLYNFMRLRALRVEVDVKLAHGRLHHRGGRRLPLAAPCPWTRGRPAPRPPSSPRPPARPSPTRSASSRSCASWPRRAAPRGDAFDLRAFHDFVWKNGNVPIALQQWEYLAADGAAPPAY